MSATKVVMVMGIQRGGTTVMFRSLACDFGCVNYHEHYDSEVFLRWNLRPEPEIRDVLHASGKPVILKPINETTFRSVEDVLTEYAAYDVHVVWIYRDAVDTFFSTIDFFAHDRQANDPFYERLQTISGPDEAVADFVTQWNRRNRDALKAHAAHPDHVTIVRYEDMLRDTSVFDRLCGRVGVKGVYIFRSNTNRGRMLDREIRTRLQEGTAGVKKELDRARTFEPGHALMPRLQAWILTRRQARMMWK